MRSDTNALLRRGTVNLGRMPCGYGGGLVAQGERDDALLREIAAALRVPVEIFEAFPEGHPQDAMAAGRVPDSIMLCRLIRAWQALPSTEAKARALWLVEALVK